ncbi:helix-turn-helix transcriptional regulator [Actinomadura sp. B10D3]|uniref:helix-turn-helix domain-containing protein n=1 Tax=Actinomadura sp. B10D3 TaxID=3153557 RepID=UPI00325F4936
MGSRNEPHEAPAIQTFASELTAWRTDAALTKTALAETLGYTPQWISQVEAAKSVPSKEFAENLDTFYKTNGLFKRLQRRIIDTRHQAILPPGFAAYQEREAEATQIRVYQLTLVHGLLQTEDYIRAVVGHRQDPDTTERFVAERLKRQEILTRENPPHVWFTLDEAALRREVAPREVMREQLAHILSLEERPNIAIDIVPLSAGYYPGLAGSFTILSFTNTPDVVYGEMAGQGMLIQEPRIVAKFAVTYNSLRGDALRVEESRSLITIVMEEMST